MRCLIRHLTRKGKNVAHRDEEVSADSLHIGRGTDNQILLADFRIAVHHASIHAGAGGLYIEPGPTTDIRINGQLSRNTRFSIGDYAWIGPYDLRRIEAPEGFDAAFSVELTRPIGDDLERLRAHTVKSLQSIGPSKRFWAWFLFIAVLIPFLAIPAARLLVPSLQETLAPAADVGHRYWNPGPISPSHQFFGDDCNTCHEQPFKRVRNDACVSCHRNVHQHADVETFPLRELTATRCASCHLEHNEGRELTRLPQGFCSDCHRNLDRRAKDTILANAGDFGGDHPEFRPTLLFYEGGKTRSERVRLDAVPPTRERSGLIFPHDKHLNPDGIDAPEGTLILDCNRCHMPEPGGHRMRPVRMAEICSECHRLEFEPEQPKRVVPHGNADEVLATIEGFYSAVALQGGFAHPALPSSLQRRPGTPLSPQQRQEALAWARDMTRTTAIDLFEKRVCKSCHEVTRIVDGDKITWHIPPVRLTEHWLPKGEFDHASHSTTACKDCHAAAKSEDSADILMPHIDDCRVCHGGEQDTTKLASGCLMCHGFHIADLPMDAAALERVLQAAETPVIAQ